MYELNDFIENKTGYYKNENLSLNIKTKKGYMKKEFHSILTYKMRKSNEKEHLCCINRDKNSVNNMRKIVKHILETGKRPEKYIRSIIKETNEPLFDSLKNQNLVKSLDVPIIKPNKEKKLSGSKNRHLVGLNIKEAEKKAVQTPLKK